MTVDIINYGCIITAINLPNKDGSSSNVVLGFQDLKDYEEYSPYYGAVVGRFANRIADGQFEVGGKSYKVAINNGPNHLHGGLKGFDKAVFQVIEATNSHIVLNYMSPDGEEGYPGNLNLSVTYRLTSHNHLVTDFEATTDQDTIINLTNHTYFNLSEPQNKILDHHLQIHASHYTPMDKNSVPSGDISPVAGTPFDFTTSKTIGQDIDSPHQQLAFGNGYDHNFVLDGIPGELRDVAKVETSDNSRSMTVATTQPGMQLYTGNFLEAPRSGFCLETQNYPDAPNKPNFPDCTLKPNQVYRHTTVFKFMF